MISTQGYMKMADESSGNSCVSCGGDKFIRNAGNKATCPFCRGTGVRGQEVGLGLKDVTKTKTRGLNSVLKAPRPEHAVSGLGAKLELMILASNKSAEAKKKLLTSVLDFEESKGRVTETFMKKTVKLIK